MSEEPDSPARPPTSRPNDHGAAPGGAGAPAKHGRLRPLTWLGTLSTVVAVATGMFTLRDQILPSDSGNAMASSSYQEQVAHVCDLVNQTNSAQPAINTQLQRELGAATTALAQRNAVLSAWKQDLGDSQEDLAAFEGLDPAPASLRARQRTTDRVWNAVVTQERRFVEQLEATNSDSGLRALAEELPALNASVEKEEQTRSSGLVNLAGGSCSLSPPLPGPIVTLRPLSPSNLSESGGKQSGNPSRGPAKLGTPGQPTPPVNAPAPTSPAVNPPTSPTPPVNPPTSPTPPVNPPTSPTPPVNPPTLIPPIHIVPGTLELRHSVPGTLELGPSGSTGAASPSGSTSADSTP